MFTDRTDAGRRLGDRLVERGIEVDVVLAIPRGGLPVGRAVADRLGVPLDVIVASKLGAPHNPELAIGAVAGDGSVWLNDDLVEQLGVSEEYVERTRGEEAEAARRKVEQYRGGEALPDLEGKRVALVDDGLATGATAVACLRQIRKAGAERTVLAVPVAPPRAVEELRGEADGIVAVETPAGFGAVGAYYRDFRQVPDEEAIEYLRDE
ncbi:phosphoribosyltransferase [Halegenticoccus soli]|uniref:phosphoribosyltransferase n=1 Tax=Halegenticoccus soli TaxID=1985678 RepID=UPI000C6E24EB|nr:phosphoribosyltransferase family protein [Halegenticoccus soli]